MSLDNALKILNKLDNDGVRAIMIEYHQALESSLKDHSHKVVGGTVTSYPIGGTPGVEVAESEIKQFP